MQMLNRFNAKGARVLSNEDLQRVAPSIFALEPWQRMSDRYRFVPTIEVVDKMRAEGFLPVYAGQSRTRIEGKRDFTRHVVRFRHQRHMDISAVVGDSVPELLLLNSHDGTSPYKIDLGIFRFVCANGLVVSSGKVEAVRARHSGSADLPSQVIDASFQVIKEAPNVMAQIEDMRGRNLSVDAQMAFAGAALELRESALELQPQQILGGRRYEDHRAPDGTRDLWRTMNVVQENLIRGGVRGRDANNRPRRTRAVSSIPEDMRLNKALWKLAEEMQRLAA